MLFNDFVFKPQVFFYHKIRRKRDWTISDGGANRNVYFFLKQDEKANNFGIHRRISGSQFLRKWIYLGRQVLFAGNAIFVFPMAAVLMICPSSVIYV